MGLEECFHKTPKQLSGGQRQRVAIARMIAKDVDVIICDEPTGSLDEETENKIVGVIKELSKKKLVLFVTHSNRIAEKYSDRIIRINNGKVAEDVNTFEGVELNKQTTKKSYNAKSVWLSLKNLKGRYSYTIKYMVLITFILLVSSLAFIFEGEFFKQYMHEDLIDTGIKNVALNIVNEGDYDELLNDLESIDHVDHATYKYISTIGIAATNYEETRLVSETHFENITGNNFLKNSVTDGRYPLESDEVLMSATGAINLLKELGVGGERLMDQYLTEEVSSAYVFSLMERRLFIVAEYGMPRIKVVGLLDDRMIFEDYHMIYYIEGFFDLFEFPGESRHYYVKLYKDDLYREVHNEIVSEIDRFENVNVNEMRNEEIHGVYNKIDSFLALSKITLYLVIVIASISFISLLFTSLFERKYEIGLYRSIGYNKRNIISILALEMLFTGVISLVIVLAMLMIFSVAVFYNLDYFEDFMDILTTLDIFGIIGSLIVIIFLFTVIIVSIGNSIILRKSIISNINDL